MKLTPFAKVFISLIILAVVGYVAWVKVPSVQELAGRTGLIKGQQGQGKGSDDTGATTSGGGKDKDRDRDRGDRPSGDRIVIGVNDFGGAYPLLLANDGAKPGPKSLFKKAGLDVEVRLIRGSKERLKAFDDGKVQVMLLTLDYLANLVPIYKQKGVDLKSFLLVDWSRGNVGIVARPEFQSIESLRRARIATTKHTPTHYLLLSLLDKSNLSPQDIEDTKGRLVFATKTPQAGEMFQRGEVDAVAIWEPHLSQAMADGRGRLLVSTATATNLIADVLYARADWIKGHEAQIEALTQAFFAAVQQLAEDPEPAIRLAAEAFEQKPEEIHATLQKIKPATFADNRAFFGLDTEECAYDRLYTEASRFWKKEGIISGDVPPPSETRETGHLQRLAPKYRTERVEEFFAFAEPPSAKEPSLLTKSVSIYFDTGQSRLDRNAQRVVDAFAETLAVFQNAYVRVEGNTDNVGARKANVTLSQARAQAVVEYLVERHRLARARFIAVGNGPDNPVADNKTEEGRAQNRRTEFKIIKTAQGGDQVVAAKGAESLVRVLQGKSAEIRACYDKALAASPGLKGKLTLQLMIGADGAVVRSRISDATVFNGGLERCILKSAAAWRLPPPPGGGTTIQYPITLQPG
jgi:NitT/TauT family transport system substrate-binding protein